MASPKDLHPKTAQPGVTDRHGALGATVFLVSV